MPLHKFKITLGAMAGPKSSILIDGVPLLVKSITIRASVDELTTVTVEIPSTEVEIEGEGYLDKTAIGDEAKSHARLPAKID